MSGIRIIIILIFFYDYTVENYKIVLNNYLPPFT